MSNNALCAPITPQINLTTWVPIDLISLIPVSVIATTMFMLILFLPKKPFHRKLRNNDEKISYRRWYWWS